MALKRSQLAEIAKHAVEEMVNSTPGILASVVATEDGFEIAQMSKVVSADKSLAALSASAIGLAGALTESGHIGTCNDIYINGSAGRVIIMSVPRIKPRVVLLSLTDSKISMGNALVAVRRGAGAIAEAVALHL